MQQSFCRFSSQCLSKTKLSGKSFTCHLAGSQMYRAAAFLAYGSAHFTRSAYLQAAKSYSSDDPTQSLEGKHVVITGANAGLGLSTALALAAK